MGKIIHVSCSGILKTNNKVLLVKRSIKQRYFPGYWCFPGGKISKRDGIADDRFRNALVRELEEELSIDISNYPIQKIDETTTPEFAPYRFENHFFLVELDDEIEIELDDEHSDFCWLDLSEIDAFFEQKGRLTIPPIPYYLKALSQNSNLIYKSCYLDKKEEILVAQYLPEITFYIVPSRALPPSKHTNVLLIGGAEKILVDPSPRNKEHVEVLLKEFIDKDIQYIFISHWHPDHHEFAAEFSRHLSVPLMMSKETLENIFKHWGDNYFDNIDLELIKPGDLIEVSKSKYRVLGHAGHAIGQLGLEPLNQSWVFLSDVFQGIGSVVVEEMDDYIQCLESLIKYPEDTVYIPSHGFPIGGSGHLQKLLLHRLERENQISKYLELQYTETQILEAIYSNLDDAMKRYALKNIKGHIKRLQQR